MTFKLYTAAAVLLPSTLPYTILLEGPVSSKLLRKSDSMAITAITDVSVEVGMAEEGTVHALVDQWATFHLGQALISALAALSATWVALSTTT